METFRKAADRQMQTHESKRFEHYSTLGNKKRLEGVYGMLVEANRNPNQYANQEQLKPAEQFKHWKRESRGKVCEIMRQEILSV